MVPQGEGTVVTVDVKSELPQTCNGRPQHPAARRQHKALVAVSGARRGGDRVGVDVNICDLGGDMADPHRIQQVRQRDAAVAQIVFVIAHPDVVKWFGAQHGDIDGPRRDAELVETPGGAERGPQPGKPGADHQHSSHHPQSGRIGPIMRQAGLIGPQLAGRILSGVSWFADLWSALPAQMRDPVLFAIPFFLLLLVLEWTAARKLQHIEAAEADKPRPASGAYLARDSMARISVGLAPVATTAGWKALALRGYAALYAYVAPWHLSPGKWYTWVVALLGVDLLYYVYHRTAHRVRLIWATHQAHHSSQYFNFATALRQKWNNSGEILMWIPLPLLGLPPWMVFFSWSLNLIYQFWVHTERIDQLPRPFEFVFNTPSHHRVHHGMDQLYLDKNYGGILIIWDRLFGSFQAE